MNINHIEWQLNDLEAESLKTIEAILQTFTKNQTILESVIDLQIALIGILDPAINFDVLSKCMIDDILSNLTSIQAHVSSRM